MVKGVFDSGTSFPLYAYSTLVAHHSLMSDGEAMKLGSFEGLAVSNYAVVYFDFFWPAKACNLWYALLCLPDRRSSFCLHIAEIITAFMPNATVITSSCVPAPFADAAELSGGMCNVSQDRAWPRAHLLSQRTIQVYPDFECFCTSLSSQFLSLA